eukprot:360078-Chlamydomonas_euryale.AAC.4
MPVASLPASCHGRHAGSRRSRLVHACAWMCTPAATTTVAGAAAAVACHLPCQGCHLSLPHELYSHCQPLLFTRSREAGLSNAASAGVEV